MSKRLILSYSEAKSFLGLLMVCIVAIILIFFSKKIIHSQGPVDSTEIKKLDSLVALFEGSAGDYYFAFDPNRLPVDSLKLLGFPDKIADRLNNYRLKGGVFYVKKDIKKIYGLSDDLYHRIAPFIQLPDSVDNNMKANVNFNINKAKVGGLVRINEIDNAMASRIIRYRNLLGGFITEDQLSEVYELEGSALNNLKKNVYITQGFQPKKIQINHATKEQLIRHPYISRQLAEDIVMFRDINGAIDSEKLLADFKSVDKGNFKKLISYLDFQ